MAHKNMVTRRSFVGAVGAGALVPMGGCSGGGEPATVQWSLEAVGDREPITDENEHEIDPGSYFTDRFEILETAEVTYEVEVLEGPSVNVFVLVEGEESAFENNESFRAIEDSISLDVSYAEEPGLELEPGVYALIIYNGDDKPENA